MFVDFCVGEHTERNVEVCLEAAYHLRADLSYRVQHEPLENKKRVLLMVTAGGGFLKLKETEYHLKSGDVLVFCPDEESFFYHTEEEQWEFWWFEFFGEMNLMEENRVLSINPDLCLEQLCQSSLLMLQNGNTRLASSVFCGILAETARKIRETNGNDHRKELFLSVCQRIQQELETITVARAAEAAGMGERELRTLFWEQCGQPPKKYITGRKLNMACFMLRNTSKTIGEISDILGFSSQFHFSRVFRERFGKAPNVWRRNFFD